MYVYIRYFIQGIPEEELLRQQQELFAQARAQQLQVEVTAYYEEKPKVKKLFYYRIILSIRC